MARPNPPALHLLCRTAAAMWWLLTAAATSSAAEPDRCGVTSDERAALQAECIGRVAEEVVFTHCPKEVCLHSARTQALVSLTDLDDRPVAEEAIDRAIERLKKTGYVRDAVARCTPSGGGVIVTIDMCANSVVQSVKISGNRYFRDREIRKRVFLRPGQVLDVDPRFPNEAEEIQRQILALRRLYAREGVALKRPPRIKVKRSGATALNLTVVLEEAERDGVREVRGAHIQALRGRPGRMSCPQISGTTIEDLTGLSSGDIVSARARRRAAKKLEKWFRSVGFVAPKATVRQVKADNGASVLVAEVRTGACWELRVWERDATVKASRDPSFRFRDPVGQVIPFAEPASFRRLPLESWREQLPFAESGVFDRSEAARGLESIEKRMEAQGFFFADVRVEHRPIKGTKGPVLGRIDYFITKNYERRLQRVTFQGRRSFSEEDLEKVIQTRSYAFLDGASYLQVAKVMDDLAMLKRFYQARGFYRFQYTISGSAGDKGPQRVARREGDWLVWEYRYRDRGFFLKKKTGDMALYLEIPFDEGPRTRVGEITLLDERGNAKHKPDMVLTRQNLVDVITLKKGETYGTEALGDDVKAIARWYRKRGYHEVRVDVTCEAFEPEPMDGLCDPSRVQGKRVDIVFRVIQGRQFTVGEVFWRGNFRTDADILVRDMPQPGAPFNMDKVNDALRRIRQLGVFNAAKADVIGLEERPPRSKVALVLSVEEAPARYLDLSLSFRNIDRAQVGKVPPLLASLVGQSIAASDRLTTGVARPQSASLPDLLLVFGMEYVDLNVLGLAQELRIPVEYGLSTRSPIRLAKVAPTWTVPWRIADQDLRVEWALTAVLSDQVTEVKDFSEFSGGVTFTLPLPDRMVVALELSGGANSFAEPEARAHPIEGPYDPFVRWAVRWRWDRQDNPLNPRRGWALSTQLSGVFATEIDSGDVELRDYIKWEVSARAAIDFSAFVLAGYFRYAGSTADELSPLPLRERYSLGGSNGMRGFADNAVGRYDADGELIRRSDDDRLDTGGNVLVNFSAEVRFPLIPDIWLWGVVFSDIGALSSEHETLFPASFRFSAGFGLRLLLFDQIPVRLDFGFPIERRCAAYLDTGQAGAQDGKGCPRDDAFNYHINVLYPF